MSYTSDEVNKAKELFRKQTGIYPRTAGELTQALTLLEFPSKEIFLKEPDLQPCFVAFLN
jgi:hypothetical protein